MKQFFYLPVLCILFLAACSPGYKKGEGGLEYKIISDNKGIKLVNGNFLQVHVIQEYKDKKGDTVLSDSRELMPQIVPFDSLRMPAASYKILLQLRKGDSLVMRVLTDSVFRVGGQPMPPFMHKGNYLYTRVRVLNIFKNSGEADSANLAEVKLARPMIRKKQKEDFDKHVAELEKTFIAFKPQIEKDSKIIEDYLAKNNIKATKGKWGTYIVIHTEGTGDKITNESVAKVNYTGKTLDSMKVFDSNVDPKFGHPEPYQITVGQIGGPEGVITGWTDALLALKKGDKATIYIPSSLGYGKSGRMPKIKPDDILIFDMEILEVQTEDQLMAEAEAKQKEDQAKMKAVMDSLKNASGNKK